MSDEVLKLRGVSVRRETSLLLRNVDWTAHEDERWIVIGPNGAGKTTLLQVAATILYPTEGTVDVLGERGARQADTWPQFEHVDVTEPLAEHLDGALSRVEDRRGHLKQGRLACPVRADHDPALVLVRGPVNVPQQQRRLAANRHATQLEHLVRHCPSSRRSGYSRAERPPQPNLRQREPHH